MAKDPYKYFRIEARELLDGLTQGVLQLERGGSQDRPAPEVLAKLLRLAHTLKGAARVVKQPQIADLAHAMEGLLAARRDSDAAPTPAQAAALLRAIDELSGHVRALDPEVPKETAPSAKSVAEEPFETVRVEIHEMDALLRDVTEAGVQLGGVRRNLAAMDGMRTLMATLRDQLGARAGEGLGKSALTRVRSIAEELQASLDRFETGISGDLERVEGELAEARAAASRLRLVPARTVFPALERAVHDAAQSLGKRAVLEASGGEARLDASVLAMLRDALLHIVRNAVAHGVEAENERVAAGKAPLGRVRLEVEREGNRVVFRCRDDGRGIDVEAVRSAAVARGVVTPQQAPSLERDAVLKLVFTAGLSTHRDVNQISGRGIGMDVVRETAVKLKGEVQVASEPGRGTTIELRVPVSLASFTGLLVEDGGTPATIPLDAVKETLLVRDGDIARTATGESIMHQGHIVPFRQLETALRRRAASRRRGRWSALIVRAGSGVAAIGVDRILGTATVLMRSLPAFVEVDAVIAGVSLDAEGNPQLVLDPGGLVAHARLAATPGGVTTVPARPPILVIDDSLTTRMLEKSILESAGYDVELATSAEEGIEKARLKRYGVFIVDVEMPGMSGFDFVTVTRADPELRHTPAILVTSRNAPEDKQRGQQAGAYAYIVKGEFDQGVLLQHLRSLAG